MHLRVVLTTQHNDVQWPRVVRVVAMQIFGSTTHRALLHRKHCGEVTSARLLWRPVILTPLLLA